MPPKTAQPVANAAAKAAAKSEATAAVETTPRPRAVRAASANTAIKATQGALDMPLTLLGGLSPQAFMARHWQKKPLLIRQAVPGVQPPLARAALFDLAAQDDVESRLIVRSQAPAPRPSSASRPTAARRSPSLKTGATDTWSLHHGPLTRRSLPPLKQPGWTLLVQGLDLHVPAAHELLRQFRFVPDARLDDVMMSYASDRGGVGPHFDSYDVFLLQVHGHRRWRIGRTKDAQLQANVPLKILQNFEPEEEWLLAPGDMLYLPPRWAHDGVAEGADCMTCSVGFRAPDAAGLAAEILARVAEHLDTDVPELYRDPKQPAVAHPAHLPADLQTFASAALARALEDPAQWQSALGELLTEPKPKVWFRLGEPLPQGVGVVLDARTRMMYDDQRIFANGESWRAAGKDARLLRQLADERALGAQALAGASPDVRALLDQWAEDGWAHPAP